MTLQQTVELVRTTIEVVEEHSAELAAPGDEAQLREAVLVFAREVAFAAAEVYAQAAEVRGAWDARLEALLVDALTRGEVGDDDLSRAAALGWSRSPHVFAIAGLHAGRHRCHSRRRPAPGGPPRRVRRGVRRPRPRAGVRSRWHPARRR